MVLVHEIICISLSLKNTRLDNYILLVVNDSIMLIGYRSLYSLKSSRQTSILTRKLEDLITRLIELALERHAADRALKTSMN